MAHYNRSNTGYSSGYKSGSGNGKYMKEELSTKSKEPIRIETDEATTFDKLTQKQVDLEKVLQVTDSRRTGLYDNSTIDNMTTANSEMRGEKPMQESALLPSMLTLAAMLVLIVIMSVLLPRKVRNKLLFLAPPSLIAAFILLFLENDRSSWWIVVIILLVVATIMSMKWIYEVTKERRQ